MIDSWVRKKKQWKRKGWTNQTYGDNHAQKMRPARGGDLVINEYNRPHSTWKKRKKETLHLMTVPTENPWKPAEAFRGKLKKREIYIYIYVCINIKKKPSSVEDLQLCNTSAVHRSYNTVTTTPLEHDTPEVGLLTWLIYVFGFGTDSALSSSSSSSFY